MKKEETNIGCPFARNEIIIKLLAVFLATLVIFFLAKTYGVVKENKFIGQDIMAQNTITVTGEGEVSAIPDIAKFSFSVVEEAETVENAQRLATEKMNKVLEFLKNSGVEDKDIKTTDYNIYPRYEWWTKEMACLSLNCPTPDRERKLVAYVVSQNISARLKKTDMAGEILAGIGALGVSNVSGLNFEIDAKDALERQARQNAIDEAQEKAEQLAKDLGVNLVRIVSFSESGGNNYPSYAVMKESLMMGGGVSATAIPEIPIGENEIKATVYITYEIK
ncbi:MAG: SIMPL domain-containing protein [Patescibacteria group bacterium]